MAPARGPSRGLKDAMFNIGPPEILLILLIALVVVGPAKLPELGRSIGRGLREFRKVQDEVRDTINFNLDVEPDAPPRARPATPRPVDTPGPAGADPAPVTGAEPAASEEEAAPDPGSRRPASSGMDDPPPPDIDPRDPVEGSAAPAAPVTPPQAEE